MSSSRHGVNRAVTGRPGEPAFITGTSTEFLGRKPLPRAIRYRPLVFVLGPSGVGKTTVSLRLLPERALRIDNLALLDAVTDRVRRRQWDPRLLAEPGLLVDGPCFLASRPGYARSVKELLELRVKQGRRTFVTESSDGQGLKQLVSAARPEQRATLVLRFPVGRGRRRYAARVCRELGIDTRHARSIDELQPWTYERVAASLRAIRETEGRDARD